MARVAFLLPRDEMLEPARKMAEKYNLQVQEICAVHTSSLPEKLNTIINSGVDILVARGLHATMIRSACDVPLVEVRLTGLEIATLVTKAKNIVGKDTPTIGLVGFGNMFADISQINGLLHVNLTPYFVATSDQLLEAAQSAVENGVDILIGGDAVCSYAASQNIPSVFIDSGEEGIEDACRIAKRLSYALDLEKRNTAEFKAILDYTFSGIVQVDAEGRIGHMNHSAEQILKKTEEEVNGQLIWSIIPALTSEMLEPVFSSGKELYSLRLNLYKTTVMASVAPIAHEGQTSGAIISINEGRQVKLYNAEQRAELLSQGFSAHVTFDDLVIRSPKMQNLVTQAKLYSRFNAPVLILGEYGTEKFELAQCIHNASDLSGNAFVSYDCDAHSEAEAANDLFGSNGLISKAQGVLYLSEISSLSLSLQYRIAKLISPFSVAQSSPYSEAGSLRIIASDSNNLEEMVARGLFRRDLYFALNIMSLEIPPLRDRPEDIQGWAEQFLQELQKDYNRYIHLSRDAWKLILNHPWQGNLAELYNVCKRLVVCSPKRNINEFFLQRQLSDAQPKAAQQVQPVPSVAQNPKLAQLALLMEKHGGNRTAIANEMGISKTTLWRYMKKMDIK